MIKRHPLPKDIEKRLERLAPKLDQIEEICFAYLFGGLARGRRDPLSDVDIAVFLRRTDSLAQVKLDLVGELTDTLGSDEFDLVILNQAPISLAGRILLNRRVLVDKAPYLRHDYEAVTLRKFYDFSRKEEAILRQRFG